MISALEAELASCAEFDFITARMVDPFSKRIRNERSDARQRTVYRLADSLGVEIRGLDEFKANVRRAVATCADHVEGDAVE